MAFLRSVLLMFVLAAVTLAGQTPAFAQRGAPESLKRVALVIGNGAYPATPLRNPVNDARAVSRALKDLGFDVTHRENLTQRAMADVIRQFGARLTPGTAAVFYYAGHGMQVQGRNFLIPVDADVQAEDEVPYSTIDVGLLLGKMEQAKSPANIVILDACRDNPFARRFRPANTGLAQMDAPIGTLLAYATAPGSVARDGGGENGVYTKHLVANLNTEGLAVEQLFKRVRVAVAQETRETQVPWESSSLKGEFVFKEAPRAKAGASQDQLIEEAVRVAAERAAAMTAERIAREQAASRPAAAPTQESQAAKQEAERLVAEREALRQERQRLEAERTAQRAETTRAEAAKKPPVQAKAPVARVSPAAPAQPAAAVPQRTGGANPEAGDTWTYRYSDGFGKTATYTVRVSAATGQEISDEMQMGRARHASTFYPGLALTDRKVDNLALREISPYLQNLGPADLAGAAGRISIFSGADPFAARLAGTETVQVPAGSFEATKLVIEGIQPVYAPQHAGIVMRRHTITVWYAPAAKRFVKATFNASAGGGLSAEKETVELMETNFAMDVAAAPIAAAQPAEARRPVAAQAADSGGGGAMGTAGLPRGGDIWTYRYSDGFGKGGTYTVRVSAASAQEISDEMQMGRARHVATFYSGLALTDRKVDNLALREISPYLQSLGPIEQAASNRINVFSGADPFTARFAGTETVQVPAGSFEATKLVIEGIQPVYAPQHAGIVMRRHTITVWYAPAAKRFVKATFDASAGGGLSHEKETIELTELRIN
jgi:uncharacterized caspase-like protein/predicted Zn-dependent protease with MMP-like domain